ncbi:MAG: CRISPR-associated helicase Cas3' [bacterium]
MRDKETNDFFHAVLGFEPYEYQLKVSEILLSGKNVILTVPTGAGKTWASIMPFLFAQQDKNIQFPRKLIYSLPLRALTNSIYSDVTEIMEKNNDYKGLASIHTGEYKNDGHFEKDIIFSTIDQTLSNFLCFPLSLSKRQANINAGSLIGSYLVFDEFHLLDPKLSMATTLGMLRALGNLSRFCIMTATLSEKYINELKIAVNAEVVSISDFPEDEAQIKSLKVPKGHKAKKKVMVKEETISASSILKHHKKKTIVICNRVEKAQQLYNEIVTSNLFGLNRKNIICLHSRFFDEDRKKKEQQLKILFGKENGEDAILISTQVVEAGMDISCDTMHLEISPINSFLQRAGRCARWENETGSIYIYDILKLEEKEKLSLETDDKEELAQIRAINNKYLPYDRILCETTFKELKAVSFIDKNISQLLVDSILTENELNDYTKIEQGDFNSAKIQQSWEVCEKNMYSQTIRDIQSIEVAIIDYEKENENSFIPYKHQTIGLFKWSFIKWAKEILNERDFESDDDVVFIVEKNADSQFIDVDANDIDGYCLKPIRDIEPLKTCYDIVFVDKSIFKYTSGAGLELGKGNTCSPLKPCDKKEKEIVEYKKDTFWQHNKAIIGCYEKLFKTKLDFAFQQLNDYWGEAIEWDKLIKAMICLHDYGKLNNEWQEPMKALQKLKGNYKQDEVLAHCDYNGTTDEEIESLSGARKKPAHAGIGAYVLTESEEEMIDATDYDELSNAISTAILKHHGVETVTYPDFDIKDEDYMQIEILLKGIDLNVNLCKKARGGNLIDNLPTNTPEWIVYLFFVRILRLSDQKATMNFEKYLNQ